MQRIVTFKVDEDLLRALDEYAKRRGMSRSEAIRAAIEAMLQANGVKVVRTRTMVDPRAEVIEIVV